MTTEDIELFERCDALVDEAAHARGFVMVDVVHRDGTKHELKVEAISQGVLAKIHGEQKTEDMRQHMIAIYSMADEKAVEVFDRQLDAASVGFVRIVALALAIGLPSWKKKLAETKAEAARMAERMQTLGAANQKEMALIELLNTLQQSAPSSATSSSDSLTPSNGASRSSGSTGRSSRRGSSKGSRSRPSAAPPPPTQAKGAKA